MSASEIYCLNSTGSHIIMDSECIKLLPIREHNTRVLILVLSLVSLFLAVTILYSNYHFDCRLDSLEETMRPERLEASGLAKHPSDADSSKSAKDGNNHFFGGHAIQYLYCWVVGCLLGFVAIHFYNK